MYEGKQSTLSVLVSMRDMLFYNIAILKIVVYVGWQTRWIEFNVLYTCDSKTQYALETMTRCVQCVLLNNSPTRTSSASRITNHGYHY